MCHTGYYLFLHKCIVNTTARTAKLFKNSFYLFSLFATYTERTIQTENCGWQRLHDNFAIPYRLLHPKRPELDIGSEYWDYRDSVVKCELYLMRVLGFQINFVHPHKVSQGLGVKSYVPVRQYQSSSVFFYFR